MRNKSFMLAAALLVVTSGPVLAAEPAYRVEGGDTLWDLSDRFWQDPETWPELWALNPQFHNPHWILPGDPIFLGPRGGERVVVRLPVEKVVPGGEESGENGAGPSRGVTDRMAEAEKPVYRLVQRQALDYVSPRRIDRWGTVDNRHLVKVAYATGEDVEFNVPAGSPLREGEKVTVFDDAVMVRHPLDRSIQGYYVHILGHLEVLAVSNGRGVGRLLETYDAVEQGAGIMAYREPLREVDLREAVSEVDGMILRGEPGQVYFSTEDLVILDRGSMHGLDAGVVLEIPVRAGERAAQGMVDYSRPLARLVVVSANERTSTGVLMTSRAAVEAGDRFVGASLSP